MRWNRHAPGWETCRLPALPILGTGTGPRFPRPLVPGWKRLRPCQQGIQGRVLGVFSIRGLVAAEWLAKQVVPAIGPRGWKGHGDE